MLLRPILVVIACLCAVHAYAETAEKKPNIVFFLIDVLGYADCGFNGGKQIKTVWSYFGIAYGFVPLVLPVLGLIWLGRSKKA